MMLPGVIVKPLQKLVDERGFFTEIMRKDWDILTDEIVQVNLSMTYPNTVRAWHKHERGQVDYFVCVSGTIKICIFDDETQHLNEIISTGDVPQIVRVPGHYWHGFKAIGDKPAILVYFVNRLYEYNNPDEIRRPWNDSTIIPKFINGNKDDPRCNKPWDWFYPPHK